MPFTFTKLPPEIRNRIYDLALCIPGEICPIGAGIHNRWHHTDAAAAKDLHINSALLRTSKQLHAEASPILYGKNHFTFIDGPTPPFSTAWDLVGMYAFFVIVGRRNRLCIRHLTVRLTKTSNAAYYAYQRNARELGESLELLSRGHGIRVLRIVFAEARFREKGVAYFNFFAGRRVVENLERVKGVGTLEISGDIDEGMVIQGKTHEMRVKDLMEVMEVGASREGGSRDVGVDESFDGSKVVNPRISERLQRLELGRDELKATVARLSSQVEELQTLSKALSGMEDLRKKLDDLANLI